MPLSVVWAVVDAEPAALLTTKGTAMAQTTKRDGDTPATVGDDATGYHIRDFDSFTRTTGTGHEIAGLYFWQQLDFLVDLAYKVSCDFVKRPHLYVNVDGLEEDLARLQARYGTDERFPSDPQRDAIFHPIFGSGGVRTLPAGASAQPEAGDFPARREDLLKATQAFAERAVDTGVEMLQARVEDTHRPLLDYLSGLNGASLAWSRDHALPTVTETSYKIFRSAGIARVFGTPPSVAFPFVEESAGEKLVESVWKQLAGSDSPVLNRARISSLQRVALRGAEALATIIDFQENDGNAALIGLITRGYRWDSAIWSAAGSAPPQTAAAAAHGAPTNGATGTTPAGADLPAPAAVPTP